MPNFNLKVRCPKCGKEKAYYDNPFRPFCSQNCALQDLVDWSDEKYQVPAEETEPLESQIDMPKVLH